MLKKLNMPTKTEGISVSLQSWLVDMVDYHARQHGKKRSEIFDQALRRYLLSDLDSPDFWEALYRKKIINEANG